MSTKEKLSFSEPILLENHPNDSRVKIRHDNVCQTLSSRMGTGGGNVPMVIEPILLESNQNHATVQTDGVSTALPASMGMGGGYIPMVLSTDYVYENHSQDTRFRPLGDICQTVSATYGMGGNNQPLVVREKSKGEQQMSEQKAVVRRLTPLECERLQGFPDGWTDIGDWKDSKGKIHKGDSDSPRYKALGNSIALPFWRWMAKRMAVYLPENATMASLFDGIGGFPLVYQANGVKPVWASEIEEFPIAVTKLRFPEEDI